MSPQAQRLGQPIKLFRSRLSGHCHRVELFMSLLGLPVDMVDVNLAAGEHKAPAFLSLNRFGQVPVLQDGDMILADSNAILVYLAKRYGEEAWLPSDAVGAARVQRWLSVAAGPLAFGPAAARLVLLVKAPFNSEEVMARAHQLFGIMEAELAHSPYLASDGPTIADIANYSYVAHAPEGNVSLVAYPQLRAWLARIENLPGFVPMASTPIGLAA